MAATPATSSGGSCCPRGPGCSVRRSSVGPCSSPTTTRPTRRFRHADDPDDVVAALGIRSMVVAPLIAGDDAFGALGTFSRHVHGFTDAQIALIRALADHAAGTIARVRLIEELGRSREELRASEERYRTLVQTMPDVIYRSDAQGRFLFMAEGAEALFGWTRGRDREPDLRRSHGPGIARGGAAQLRGPAHRTRSVHRYRYQIKRRDGEHAARRGHVRRGLGGRPVRRRPGHRPRDLRTGSPRARSRGVGGALPVPRRALTRPRLRDRRGGPVHVHVGGARAHRRLASRGRHRPALLADHRSGAALSRSSPAGTA